MKFKNSSTNKLFFIATRENEVRTHLHVKVAYAYLKNYRKSQCICVSLRVIPKFLSSPKPSHYVFLSFLVMLLPVLRCCRQKRPPARTALLLFGPQTQIISFLEFERFHNLVFFSSILKTKSYIFILEFTKIVGTVIFKILLTSKVKPEFL